MFLCVYAQLNKLEERGNEIQQYMYFSPRFSPLNTSKNIFITVLQNI